MADALPFRLSALSVMSYNSLEDILDGPFKITPRPEPIPGDLRRSWGITLVLLALHYSYGKRASLQKLHFLAYAARTSQSRELVQGIFNGIPDSDSLVIRIEPWVNRALAFARGAALVTMEKGKAAKLTAKGSSALAVITTDDSILSEERTFLSQISKFATEDTISRLMKARYKS
jgi:hypothetical protein